MSTQLSSQMAQNSNLFDAELRSIYAAPESRKSGRDLVLNRAESHDHSPRGMTKCVPLAIGTLQVPPVKATSGSQSKVSFRLLRDDAGQSRRYAVRRKGQVLHRPWILWRLPRPVRKRRGPRSSSDGSLARFSGHHWS